jgi:hypothetical protein
MLRFSTRLLRRGHQPGKRLWLCSLAALSTLLSPASGLCQLAELLHPDPPSLKSMLCFLLAGGSV